MSRLAMAFTVFLAAAWITAAAPAATGGAPEHSGASLYRTHCASCHGVSGRGDGAVAPYLRVPPADLTRLAIGNGGAIPAERLARVIDGRQAVRAHGSRDMPVWGLVFSRSTMMAGESAIDPRIQAIVEHLATLQQKPAE